MGTLGFSRVQGVTLIIRLRPVDILDRHWWTPPGELMGLPMGKVVPACASSLRSCKNTVRLAGVQVTRGFFHCAGNWLND